MSVPYEDAADPEYLSEEEGIRTTFRRSLERIERHRTHRGRLLDVGCGPGLLLEEARLLGWEAVGMEPSTWGVEEARRRGFLVHQGLLGDEDLESGSFGAVVASDVVEHVPDPVAFVRTIRDLLEPGGVVLLTTPNVDSLVARTLRRWWWSVLPGHLLYFSPPTLRRLLEGNDLEVLELDTHPKTFSLTYYAGRLCGYSEAAGETARSVADALGGRHRLVTPDFRDRIACVARKPDPHGA